MLSLLNRESKTAVKIAEELEEQMNAGKSKAEQDLYVAAQAHKAATKAE